jgi:hypothetical protein
LSGIPAATVEHENHWQSVFYVGGNEDKVVPNLTINVDGLFYGCVGRGGNDHRLQESNGQQ